MSQTSSSKEIEKPAPDATATRILNAAHIQVMAVGVRRTTLTDVAERAGLSRMTVYRRFPDVGGLLEGLMTRELAWILEQSLDEAAAAPHERARIVSVSVRSVALLVAHPLWLRLLDVDPELLLPYLTRRLSPFQHTVIAELTARCKAGMKEGSVREGDPVRFARAIELAARGHAMAAGAERTRRQRPESLADLALMIDGLLDPD